MAEILDRLTSQLADRYLIERELGRGGMATVFLAKDIRHDRDVAIKVLHPELSVSIGAERFEREIKLAAKLQHPNILGLYDSGSAFYIWARIPEGHNDAIAFNEMLMRDAGVGMTPGSAFADTDTWDKYVRICIAREDSILEGAMEKLKRVLD